jgi:hypothetical protein
MTPAFFSPRAPIRRTPSPIGLPIQGQEPVRPQARIPSFTLFRPLHPLKPTAQILSTITLLIFLTKRNRIVPGTAILP